MMTKSEIRTDMRRKRQRIDAAETILIALAEFLTARLVCSYMPLPGEMDTHEIVEESWKRGKQVCVPAYRDMEQGYGLARLCRDSEMIEGRFCVMEPARKEWVDISEVDFIVVPGLAFDRFCGRVGHGGGYYDRIMSAGVVPFMAGLGFDWQVLDLVPMEDDDVRLDAVITDKRVIRPPAPGDTPAVIDAGGRRR
jgi:5-formyltetrahydrofolate cyclo-ligase